jgi:Family of unknown function (DUF5309)
MAVLGMRGTGTFSSVERPQNWRQGILLYFPNGDAPLTAFMSKLKDQPTDDPQFHWFEKGLPIQRGTIRGAGAADAPADDASIAAGQTADAYLKMVPDGSVANDVSIYKVGHVVFNEKTEESMLVVAVTATSIRVRRDSGDKFTSNPAITGGAVGTGDGLVIIGTGNPEGAQLGQAIAYKPVRQYNYTQIFRTPLSLTRTARKTRLRYDDEGPYREAKREALQIHSIEMEKAFLFGEREEILSVGGGGTSPLDITSTGQPLRLTRGFLNWLPPVTTAAISVNTDLVAFNPPGSLTEKLWDQFLEVAFRYGSREKLAFAGSGALLVLNELAKNKARIELAPTDDTYGFHLMRYITPFGTLLLYNHPLMTDNPTWRYDVFVIDPDKLNYRFLDDTKFLRNRQSPGEDASRDEFLTECGLEVHCTGVAPDVNSPSTVPLQSCHARMKGMREYGG